MEELQTPKNWTHFTHKKTVKQWSLDPNMKNRMISLQDVDKQTYQTITNAFQRTGLGSKTIVSIQRLESIALYEKYAQECQRMFKYCYTGPRFKEIKDVPNSNGQPVTDQHLSTDLKKHLFPAINEFYFFHGTKVDYLDKILQQGLDNRLSSVGRVGKGVYGAEMASKSYQYVGMYHYYKLLYEDIDSNTVAQIRFQI